MSTIGKLARSALGRFGLGRPQQHVAGSGGLEASAALDASGTVRQPVVFSEGFTEWVPIVFKRPKPPAIVGAGALVARGQLSGRGRVVWHDPAEELALLGLDGYGDARTEEETELILLGL